MNKHYNTVYYYQHCQNMNIKIGDINIEPSPHVKNLAVVFDQTWSMEKHVNSVSRTCHYHMGTSGGSVTILRMMRVELLYNR